MPPAFEADRYHTAASSLHDALPIFRVGDVGIGGDNPIRVQSMITCDTMDTGMSIQQTIELANVGCEIVRITAPTDRKSTRLNSSHVASSYAVLCLKNKTC